MSYVLSLDIGGTKIATVVANQEGEILSRIELASLSSDRESMFAQVVKSIQVALDEANIPVAKVLGMGLGVPGKIDREKGVAVFQNNLPWEDFPIVERLKKEFPIEHIALDNDVYMATYAEWQTSGANEQETFVYMTVSTGISLAIIHEGRFLRGNGFAGEVGMLPLNRHSPKQGNRSLTLEDVASGSAIQAQAQKEFNQPEFMSKDLFAAYEAEDERATKIIHDMAENLAYGIYSLVCVLDPSQIVLGGGVMNHQPIMVELIKQSLDQYLITEQKPVLDRLKTSQFKGDSGVMGGVYQAMKCLEDVMV